VVILWAAMRWWSTRRLRDAAGLGAAIAVAMHERGTAGSFVLPALLWMAWSLRGGGRRRLVMTWLALVAGFGLVIAPWTIRNYRLYGQPVLMATLSAELFWRGNNPHASGTALTRDGLAILDAAPAAFQARVVAQADELGQQRLFSEAAWAYIQQDPLAFVGRTLRKLYFFFWFSPQSGIRYPATYFFWYRLYYVGVLVLALVGLGQGLSARQPMLRAATWAIVGVVLSMAVAQSLYYVEGRHRWWIEPLLLILTAVGVSTVGHWLRRRLLVPPRVVATTTVA